MKRLTLAAFLCIAAVDAAQAQITSARPVPANKPDPNVKPTPPKAAPGRSAKLQPVAVTNPTLGPGSNACGTPTAIGGPGTFAFDNTAATNDGPQVCGLMGKDVWFAWTAGGSGSTTVDTCGEAAFDTVITVYGVSTCPVAGDSLGCSDDFCGAQSSVTFNAVASTTYMIQVGGFNGASGAGTFTISAPVGPPANDSCATPALLVGAGPFATTNVGATTGAEGQAEGICFFFGSTAIADDVWHTWVATSSGPTTISLCPGPGTIFDSKLAVYDGAGCPASAALACNDDSCGLTSQLTFCATMGNSYTIQLGNYPLGGASQGTATLTISTPPVTPLGEGSTNPVLISGFGTFAFDNTAATTDTPMPCGSSAGRDLWWRWTAPSTGTACIDTCGQTGVDTVLATYDTLACPGAGPLIICNDDFCGFQSFNQISITMGTEYLIQLGSFGTSAGGSGTFTIATGATFPGCRYDDGSTENSIGITGTGPHGVIWFHRYGAIGESAVVEQVSTAYGTPAFPGSSPPAGTPTTICVWDDPNDDGDPTDCVLLASVASTVQNGDTDILNDTPISPPEVVSGVYFVGVAINQPTGFFPAPLDQSCVSSNGRAWIAGNVNAPPNINNLGANSIPPGETDSFGFPGVWLLRADCTAKTSVTPICFGDGSGPACPCANNGIAGHGCANSADSDGGLLSSAGSPSLGADTLVVTGSDMKPSSLCVLFQGLPAAPVIAGDGLRCMNGGGLTRLFSKSAATGTASMPVGADPTISARSAAKGDPLSVGSVRVLALFYRDQNPTSFCPPANFNVTNGLKVVWGP